MKNKIYFIVKLLLILIFHFLMISKSNSEVIEKFDIRGNERVSDETIIMFSKLELGEDITIEKLNDTFKNLYETNYFKNVEIDLKSGVVIIKISENPIIQSIEINGIKQNNIYENIRELTLKSEKYPFVESKINEQTVLLKNLLKSYGYYFVELETAIIENDNNTVNLKYSFNLGEIAEIKKIKFIGKKIFKDRVLRNVIVSEETKFWKFITRNKFLDVSRINLDILRLENFYKNRGFFNVKIKSTTAVINDDNQFELIFNINSGKKFYFDQVKFLNRDKVLMDDLDTFDKKFSKLKGKKYSKKKLNNLIDEINDFTIENEFIFVNVDFQEIIKSENQIDILIKFDDLDKIYIDRINILGNYITDEKVIRNSLIVDEGDPFNKTLFNKSIQNIKSKNIFKLVEFETSQSKNLNKIVNITVEEKPTGEIFAGAGTGTTGSSISAGVKENNYLGQGIQLDTNFTITEDSIKGKFSASNPNFRNSDKSIKTSLESSSDDFMSDSGYKTSRTGISVGTGFEQKNNLFVNLELSNFYEDLETSSSATDIIKKQEGNYFENLLTYRITYNKLDQNFQPTDGFVTNFSQTLPIYSDDKSLENSFTSSTYHSISENLLLSAKFYLKTINSFDDNVRVSKRVNVPSRLLRGFESGKIGPKDGNQFIGGNYATALNLNSTLPNILFENENIDFNLFVDVANVWEVDYNSSLDSNKIRSAAGFAVNWFSVIGPLTFSYAIPLSDSNTDITEKFRFQIGTSF